MRQRLGIARALVNDPVVVFLDEPTLGLDPAGQRQVLDIVREIATGRGATVVLSTHTLPEVEAVCTSVLILDRGGVVVSGTVGEVTRSVTASRSGQLRVPVALVGRARDALAGIVGLTIDAGAEHGGMVRFSLTGDGRPEHADAGMNAALRAVLAADVPVLSFEVEGARLRDAFLAMTGESVS
jgi:ABC-2 type transport system ATP-binding protein